MNVLGIGVAALIIVLPIVIPGILAFRHAPKNGDYSQRKVAGWVGCVPVRLLMIPLIIGVLATLLGFSDVIKWWSSQNWAEVQGQVYYSSIEEQSTALGTGYNVKVEYHYTRPDNQFPAIGHDVTIGNFPMFDQQAALERLQRYAPDTPVTIYYNPDNSYEAVLERKLTMSTYLEMGIGSAFSLLGAVALYFFLKNLRLRRFILEAAARNEDYGTLLYTDRTLHI